MKTIYWNGKKTELLIIFIFPCFCLRMHIYAVLINSFVQVVFLWEWKTKIRRRWHIFELLGKRTTMQDVVDRINSSTQLYLFRFTLVGRNRNNFLKNCFVFDGTSVNVRRVQINKVADKDLSGIVWNDLFNFHALYFVL